jgi:uncharacterized membrane protein
MSFEDRTKRQKAFIVAGMACLAISGLLQMLVHPTTRLATDWLDAARGLLLGMSIALNIGWLRLSNRRQSCASG